MFLNSNASKKDQGTFRPVKRLGDNHRGYKLNQISQSTLGSGDVKTAVKLPEGENLNDWLAVNVVDFYNQLSCLYAPVAEHCTPKTCPEMTAGPKFKYAWQDNKQYKKATMLPANEYITNVMSWTESYINNEKCFPSDPTASFPSDFLDIVKKIFQRLFRIYAHIYHHHREDIKSIGAEAHLNTSFRHFIYFSKEFQLIPEEQLAPLKEIIDQL
ncbi:Mitotic exit network component, variant 2 [Tritrichomonas musculus]|uniref:Mitotic exit network component, variant 2 n=1 Tax=Tritrichomonas musculus TaxID=1915356 RepID=A0ABR2KTI1_9EUKA